MDKAPGGGGVPKIWVTQNLDRAPGGLPKIWIGPGGPDPKFG